MTEHKGGQRCVAIVASAALLLLMAGTAILAVRAAREGPIFLLGISSRPVRHKFTQENYEKTRERADAIIEAIAAYEAQHGTYPEHLEMLVPAYLPAIDPPVVGDGEWQYRGTEDRFTLGFFVGPIYEGDLYDSREGDWYVDR